MTFKPKKPLGKCSTPVFPGIVTPLMALDFMGGRKVQSVSRFCIKRTMTTITLERI